MTETQVLYVVGMIAGGLAGIALAFLMRPMMIRHLTAARRVNALKVTRRFADGSEGLTADAAVDLLTQYRDAGALTGPEFESEKASVLRVGA